MVMMENQHEFDRFRELLDALCNGTLSDEDARRLDARLIEDPQARRIYTNTMFLHAELYWAGPLYAGGDDTPPPDSPPVPGGEGPRGTWTGSAGKLEDDGTPPSTGAAPVLSFFEDVGGILRRGAWIAAPLLLVAVLSLWGALTLFGRRHTPDAQLAGADREAGPAVAQITGTRNCLWSRTGNRLGYGTRLVAGQRLQLERGLAEITFNNGAQVILEGPATFLVNSSHAMVLDVGRLAATVPKQAKGFTVQTRRFRVVDLGTEFGLVTDAALKTEVHVFAGQIEGYVLGQQGETLSMLRLATDEAARLNADRTTITSLTADAEGFVRTLASPDAPHGGLYAYEGFFYPTGPLTGRNAGFGWSGPWFDIESGTTTETNRIAAGSLKYPGLVPAGNRAAQVAQNNRIRRTLDTSAHGIFDRAGLVENQNAVRLIGRDGTSLYVSFLQRVTIASDVFYGLEMHRGDGNANRVLSIGHGAEGTGYGVTSETNGGASQTFQPLGAETTDVNFIVVKFTFGPGNQDVVEVYRNPESLADERACRVDARLTGNFSFDRIGMGNFEGNKVHEVDQIRVGRSFQAVTCGELLAVRSEPVRLTRLPRVDRRSPFTGRALLQGQTKGSGTFFGVEVGPAASGNWPKNEPDPTRVSGYDRRKGIERTVRSAGTWYSRVGEDGPPTKHSKAYKTS